MITDRNGMIQLEADADLPVSELMENAGAALADAIRNEIDDHSLNILILAGSGNNGGDGSVICRLLKEYKCRIVLIDGRPKTEAAQLAYRKVPRSRRLSLKYIEEAVQSADVIIDAVYGFSYHGDLKPEIRKIFSLVNRSDARVFSADINSGAESDSGYFDRDAIISDITFALDCYKPFHMMRKEHRLFRKAVLLPLNLPHARGTLYREMDEETFFAKFPKKSETAYKGTYGKTLLVGGCGGMAGALCLNILGAKTVGAPYIEAALPEYIYPIAAVQHMTAVFRPFGHNTAEPVVLDAVRQARATAFGSGAVWMDRKQECMDLILQNSRGPVVLDAEALRMLVHNTYLLRFVKCPVILTPHIGEFAALLNRPVETVMKRKLELAKSFAAENKVTLVLKGPNTICVSPAGEVYINQSGNQALAQAGSGDVLTGIMAAILTMNPDVFDAVCMAVWIHGYIAELGMQDYSAQTFRLESFPDIMNRLFMKHGY